MENLDITRIADALERIATALEQRAARGRKQAKPSRDDESAPFAQYIEMLTDNTEALVGRMTMDEILAAIKMPSASSGERHSIGYALAQLGVRRGRSANQRFYVFPDKNENF